MKTLATCIAAGAALAALALLAPAPASADELDPGAAKSLTPGNPCAPKGNPCNPCGPKGNPCNPCNPCAPKANPCNPCNPCAPKANPCNPCGPKGNPCGAKGNPCNPCGGGRVDASRFQQPAGVELASGRHPDLIDLGEKLWNDRSLGNSGIACATCHTDRYGQMNESFDAPYPHRVAMPAHQAGVEQVNAAEMVNFCMIVPMQDDPLPWDSRELAALTAWVEKIQAGYEPGANPCGAKANPCNPCNPCGKKANPCSGG